ncbi:MAG: flagellar hook-basal body complex protein FliE [Synergistaceae bacterium]|jgi:flagellar hook-basal body complex protein FliE|nr:flagellar hook-basal body complex protein FliE [Synergistaceae bacterium]
MIDSIRVEPVSISDAADPASKADRANNFRKSKTPSFTEVLKDSVLKVNQLQKDADNMTNRLALGEVDDISEVSIAVEKAELALRMMVQIRDKMLDAYQQISRMTA